MTWCHMLLVLLALVPTPAFGKSKYSLGAYEETTGLGDATAVAIGDVTGDGLADLLVASGRYTDAVNDEHLHLLAQQSDGTLDWTGSWEIVSGDTSIVIGDLDEDGIDDVIAGIDVFLADGAGGFTELGPNYVSTDDGTGGTHNALADIDGDGHLDWVTTGSAEYSGYPVPLFTVPGAGDGSFGEPVSVMFGFDSRAADLELGDVDGDGFVDVVARGTNSAGDAVRVHFHDGVSAISADELVIPISGWLEGVGVGDFVRDGIDDPCLADMGAIYSWDVHTRVADGPYGIASGGTALVLEDVDGDGTDDVIVGDPNYKIVGVSLGIGVYYQPEATYAIPSNSMDVHGLAVGDLDGDGCTDVAVARQMVGVAVLYGSGCATGVDTDGDGVDDAFDDCVHDADADQTDSDWDYIGDPCDVCPAVSDEDQADADRDGIGDACDACPSVADIGTNVDGDSFGDACDVCPEVSDDGADTDGDSIGDACDPCPDLADDGADVDADGIGDACDSCPTVGDDGTDADGDGRGDACDSCPGDAEDGADADGDGVGDACDVCPGSGPEDDRDADGIGDTCDSCPDVADEGADADGDGIGDACDSCPDVVDDGADSDGDGVGDACDACPGSAPADDRDGDGLGDTCDLCPDLADDGADADFDRIGDACDSCPDDWDQGDDADGDGVGDACDVCPDVADAGADTDGDGVGDACDACPGSRPTEDVDDDGIGDSCDVCPTTADDGSDRDGDGRGDACDVCPDLADNGDDIDGDGVGDACEAAPVDTDTPAPTGCGCAATGTPTLVLLIGALTAARVRREVRPGSTRPR